ncbi:MAG: hypothetical protein AAF198_05370 [Pseudomonadota bacterium]
MGQLDVAKRFKPFFMSANGGLNDQLNQIVNSFRYCRSAKRNLIIDWNVTGLARPFSVVFDEVVFRGVEIICYENTDLTVLNAASTCPEFLKGKIDVYQSEFPIKPYLESYFDPETGQSTKFDYGASEAELIVHQSSGGGKAAIWAFNFLKIKPAYGDRILTNLFELPDGYAALLLRHTDLKADLPYVFGALKGIVKDTQLLICSDNPIVQQTEKDLLYPSTRLLD